MKIYKLLIAITCLVLSSAYAGDAERISWTDLLPENWNPQKVFEDMTDEEFNALSDEEYMALNDKVQAELDNAPIVEGMDGKQVKIPGFIVPLDFNNAEISEFLLVPYFGACTHTPPPPANQIILGKLKKQMAVENIFDPVWITGKMQAKRESSQLSEIGVINAVDIQSAYSMEVEGIESYLE